MFDRHGSGRNSGNMDPTDLVFLAELLGQVFGPVVVQLSTYSANNNNPQEAVAQVIVSALQPRGLTEAACIRVDGNMMSLVLVRDVVESRFAQLGGRFTEWLTSFGAGVPASHPPAAKDRESLSRRS